MPHARTEKIEAAKASVFAAIFLTALKGIVGVLTGSLGILAEALHSLLDLAAAGLTFFSVKFSERPADASHQYGHGKIENVSAMAETILLMATCVWVAVEAVQRITGVHHPHVEANIWGVGVMVISIAVDWHRAHRLKKAAIRYRSQALEADALHFSSDILSSMMVIVGLLFTRFGYPIADSIAALGVSAWILVISIRLGMRALSVLLDSAPRGLREQVVNAAAAVEGVDGVTQVRVRQAGATTFADLNLVMDGDLTLEQVHNQLDLVEDAVHEVIPGADIILHAEPQAKDQDSLVNHEIVREELRVLGAELGFRFRQVRILKRDDGMVALFTICFPGRVPLEQARRQTDEIERILVRNVEFLTDAQARIESADCVEQAPENERELLETAEATVRAVPGVVDCHEITLTQIAKRHDGSTGWLMTVHVTVDRASTVAESQLTAAAVEKSVKSVMTAVTSVHVHQEAISVKP